MTDFLHSFVKSLVIANLKVKKIERGKKALKEFPKMIPMQQPRIRPMIPPPRVLPKPILRTQIPVPIPTREEVVVPKPSQPIQSMPQINQPVNQMKVQDETPVTSGYTKIVLPDVGDEVPITGREISQESKPIPEPNPLERMIPIQQKILTPPAAKPTSGIDFGAITELVNDPYVKAIEYGEGKLKIRTSEGEKDKGALSEDEAKKIVQNFANSAGVKIGQTIEAIHGKLKLSAVNSEILGISFSIEKI